MKSGNNKTATCTLVKGDHSFLPNQDTNNEKLWFGREDLNTYEDIQWDTIISWRKCETPVDLQKQRVETYKNGLVRDSLRN